MATVALVEKGGPGTLPPNLADYGSAVASFSWVAARRELQGLPAGRGLNIAHECVDRHAVGAAGDRRALRLLSREGQPRNLSYSELRDLTSRFANALAALGVGRGERVFTLLGRVPELYVAALGALKNGSVFCPLLTTLGPEPIRARLERGGAALLVTTEGLYRRNVQALRAHLPQLRHVLLVSNGAGAGEPPGTRLLAPLLAHAAPSFDIPPTAPEDAALLHFTSGTTQALKGALLPHGAIVAIHATGKLALDLHPEDVYWCPADPGWVTGTCYGILAPLACGVASVVDREEFEAERCYRILQDEKVTVWYTTPTALRMLMKAGADAAWSYDLSALRFIASVGEPLAADSVRWASDALGRPVHDNWWQTETGAIMLANFASMPLKPGSMGRPVPGVRAEVLVRGGDGSAHPAQTPEAQGELALEAGWPSMFSGYVGDPERYRRCFEGPYYVTGDLVRRDADGYYWFLGRSDDVIKSAGHIIGPFEVESALLDHPAVAEVAVVGKPDPVAHEVAKAFVVVGRGFEPSAELRRELLGWARARLGEEVAPADVEFVSRLPRTQSGKIMRRLLRARELGLAPADPSTLEATE